MNDRFRRGSGCFECEMCGRETRETGDGNAHLGFCPQCRAAAEIENAICDEGDADGSQQACIDRLYNEAVAKGGKVEGYPKAVQP